MCPKCGANWPTLEESLQAPKGCDDYTVAVRALGRCQRVCGTGELVEVKA